MIGVLTPSTVTCAVWPTFTSSKPEVRSTIEIAAPPAKVFRALLEPELMNKWLFGAAVVDKNKRAYSYGWKYDYEGKKVLGGPTRILELVENEKLVTDWPDWRGDETKPVTGASDGSFGSGCDHEDLHELVAEGDHVVVRLTISGRTRLSA